MSLLFRKDWESVSGPFSRSRFFLSTFRIPSRFGSGALQNHVVLWLYTMSANYKLCTDGWDTNECCSYACALIPPCFLLHEFFQFWAKVHCDGGSSGVQNINRHLLCSQRGSPVKCSKKCGVRLTNWALHFPSWNCVWMLHGLPFSIHCSLLLNASIFLCFFFSFLIVLFLFFPLSCCTFYYYFLLLRFILLLILPLLLLIYNPTSCILFHSYVLLSGFQVGFMAVIIVLSILQILS